jgi:transcriptional regulator with XRE-family HTH domain
MPHLQLIKSAGVRQTRIAVPKCLLEKFLAYDDALSTAKGVLFAPRKTAGLTDLWLGRTYVGGIERAERNVALVNIEKIARALKLSLSELMRGA